MVKEWTLRTGNLSLERLFRISVVGTIQIPVIMPWLLRSFRCGLSHMTIDIKHSNNNNNKKMFDNSTKVSVFSG